MSTTVVINGLNYYIPAVGENNWGQNVSDALIALATATAGAAGFINQVPVSSSPITVVSGRTYLVDTSAARTLNLPAPANNAYLQVKDVTGTSPTNNITVHRFASEQINGVAADKVLSTSKGMWTFISDGTNWFMLDDEDTQRLGRDGTVLLPFYTFGLDVDTGIYRVGADILGIATGGVVGITVNASQQLTVPKTSNQIIFGTTNTTTLSFTAPAASRTYTIPDVLGAADFLLTAGAQTITGAKTFTSSTLLLQEVSSTDVVTIAVAALAASRIYTLPDAGGAAEFVMNAGAQTIAGIKSFSAVTLHADGAVGAPSVSFINDTDCGFYRLGANNLGLAINGVKTMDFGANTQVTSGAFQVANGTAGAPSISFINDADTGIFWDTNSNVISFANGGVRKWQMSAVAFGIDGSNSAGQFIGAAGSAAAPSYSFNVSGATGDGMYSNGSDSLGFATNGAEALVLGVTEHAMYLSGVQKFQWQATQYFPSTDNATKCGRTGNRWSEVWAANGTIQTSMLETKTNVEYMEPDECKIPKAIYFNRSTDEHDKQQLGFEADVLPEEAHPVIDPETGERSKEDVYTSAVIAMLCQAARNDYERFKTIEAKLAALEQKLQ